METRNITVVSTRDQKRSVVSTNATTLAELKGALRAAGVDYDGMTFYEGLTHTELLTDDSILPHDVPYKGTITNELVFMLTTPNKKIKSGALPQARAALFATILEKNLEEACVSKFGKNFTNCSNRDLLQLIEENSIESVETPAPCNCSKVIEAMSKAVDFLYRADLLTCEEVGVVKAILNANTSNENSSSYSVEEVEEMFNFLND